MPINAHPDYLNAESEYHGAATPEDKLIALEKMMKTMPKHKGAESLRKNVRTRYKKLKQEIQVKKKKSGAKKGIKKEDMQATLIGLTNTGKSSVLKILTNAEPKIASYGFTTKEPEIGTLHYQGCPIQILDMPPIGSEDFDYGIINNTDTLLIVVEKINEIKSTLDLIKNKETTKKPKIIVFNKIDQYDDNTKRKISETLKSKRYKFVLISTFTDEGLKELKKKILNTFDIIRIYTRQPGKKQDDIPIILKPNATLQDAAEKILHGYSKKVKYAKVTGPSSKFANQRIGLKHQLKDKDIVEFYTE